MTPVDDGNAAAPRAAYLHVPFCRRRCGYCNFAVIVGREDLADDFLRAIQLEWSALGGPRPVDTLYFGGGTPTQLGREHLERLCRAAVAQHPLAPGGEWTVEANPDDVDAALVAMLAEVGVTRVSLGSQSLNPGKLIALDRSHEPNAVRSAAEAIQSAGLQLATDLIFAAPGETLADWQADLAATLALAPDHISTYGLTLERGTAFFSQVRRGELQLAAETLDHNMYAAAIDTLTAAGFDHYEISNFALPQRRSRHNEAYWAGAEYYAAGPGAARYVAGVREGRFPAEEHGFD